MSSLRESICRGLLCLWSEGDQEHGERSQKREKYKF